MYIIDLYPTIFLILKIGLKHFVFLFDTEDGKPVSYGAVSQGPGGCGIPDAPGKIFASIFAVMSLVNDILVRYRVKLYFQINLLY